MTPNPQRGSVLPIALILSIVMALSAVAFVKMVDSSSLLARNASFQRDALNRNDVMINAAVREFENSGDAHFRLLQNTNTSVEGAAGGFAYSAVALPSDAQGVPAVLKDDAAFAAAYGAAAATEVETGNGMTTRVVIDRMCSLEQPVEPEHCSVASLYARDSCSRCSNVSSPLVPVFRITARTEGPRRTESYSQALVSLPVD